MFQCGVQYGARDLAVSGPLQKHSVAFFICVFFDEAFSPSAPPTPGIELKLLLPPSTPWARFFRILRRLGAAGCDEEAFA